MAVSGSVTGSGPGAICSACRANLAVSGSVTGSGPGAICSACRANLAVSGSVTGSGPDCAWSACLANLAVSGSVTGAGGSIFTGTWAVATAGGETIFSVVGLINPDAGSFTFACWAGVGGVAAMYEVPVAGL